MVARLTYRSGRLLEILGQVLFVRVHRRQPDGESRTLIRAVTLGPRRAAVQLDEVTNDRESESQTTVVSRRRAVCLAEAIEDVRQEVGPDADAGIIHDDLHVRVDPLQRNLDHPALPRKLHTVRE